MKHSEHSSNALRMNADPQFEEPEFPVRYSSDFRENGGNQAIERRKPLDQLMPGYLRNTEKEM